MPTIDKVTYPTADRSVLQVRIEGMNINRKNEELTNLVARITDAINSTGSVVESSALMESAKTISFSLSGGIDNDALSAALVPVLGEKAAIGGPAKIALV